MSEVMSIPVRNHDRKTDIMEYDATSRFEFDNTTEENGADNEGKQDAQGSFVQSSAKQILKKEPEAQSAPAPEKPNHKPDQKSNKKAGAESGNEKPASGTGK